MNLLPSVRLITIATAQKHDHHVLAYRTRSISIHDSYKWSFSIWCCLGCKCKFLEIFKRFEIGFSPELYLGSSSGIIYLIIYLVDVCFNHFFWLFDNVDLFISMHCKFQTCCQKVFEVFETTWIHIENMHEFVDIRRIKTKWIWKFKKFLQKIMMIYTSFGRPYILLLILIPKAGTQELINNLKKMHLRMTTLRICANRSYHFH